MIASVRRNLLVRKFFLEIYICVRKQIKMKSDVFKKN